MESKKASVGQNAFYRLLVRLWFCAYFSGISAVAVHRRQHNVFVIVVMQRIQQLGMNTAKPAIAHHQHMVAWTRVLESLADQLIDIAMDLNFVA